MKVEIKNIGLEISPKLKKRIQLKFLSNITKVNEVSNARLTFIQIDDTLEGTISIEIEGKTFYTSIIDKNPIDMTLELAQDISEQYDQWRRLQILNNYLDGKLSYYATQDFMHLKGLNEVS